MQGVTQVPTSTPGGGYGSMGTSPPPLSGDANPPAYFAAAIDARQVMQRRCARCKQYYTNSDADPTCWFHPGHFVEHKSVMQGASVGWSCCRFADDSARILRPEATNKHCKGCKKATNHVEDKSYSTIVASFPFDAELAAAQVRTAVPPQDAYPTPATASPATTTTLATPAGPPQNIAVVGTTPYIVHHVADADTLEGLAIRYNVSAGAIQRVNRLPTREVFHLKTLLVPLPSSVATPASPSIQATAVDNTAALRKRFMVEFGCTNEEAKYHLEMTHYNYEAAAREYQSDKAWEEKHPKPDQ
eukprot:TRINITY_DN1498_c0_g1_i8.p1 TRINITY_DN1498_c0_g1~~TRINITY_DN1498_c0_g1_i8.p1  ORF type:complete len:302 (-),score=77.12 TRINITY_DN1498_c0_g1_i8:146-1051(-)